MRRTFNSIMAAFMFFWFAILLVATLFSGGRNGNELHTTLRTAINPQAAVSITAQQTQQVRIEADSAERRAAERQQTIRWAIGAIVALGAMWATVRTVPVVLPLLVLLLKRRDITVHLPAGTPPELVEARWHIVDMEMGDKGYELVKATTKR